MAFHTFELSYTPSKVRSNPQLILMIDIYVSLSQVSSGTVYFLKVAITWPGSTAVARSPNLSMKAVVNNSSGKTELLT